ncbi:MAG: YtxH domain-containing protein [Cyclobacteriaceae bacterium]
MSAGKTLFTFITGIAAGLALAYAADPKGSKKTIKKLEKELKSTKKMVDEKLETYKADYTEAVDKYSDKSKGLINQAKELIDQTKKKATS